ERKARQIGQGRVAGAEIVEREADAELFEARQHMRRLFRIVHDQRFSELQPQAAWLQGGPGYHRTHVAHEVAADQLTAGKIDRDGQRRVADLFLPCSQVLGCLLHGEEAELHDQPAILGHGNEVGWWNHATPRMFPAQQRLEAGDAVVLETHNRLIGERELPPLYGAAQIRFELEAVSADSTESG